MRLNALFLIAFTAAVASATAAVSTAPYAGATPPVISGPAGIAVSTSAAAAPPSYPLAAPAPIPVPFPTRAAPVQARADRALSVKVRDDLVRAMPGVVEGLSVAVANGKVVLSGAVPTQQQKFDAGLRAAGIAGGTGFVSNQLVVK
jgi:hypothetical protein